MLLLMDHPIMLTRTILGIVGIGQIVLLCSIIHRGFYLILQVRLLPLLVVPDNAHLKLSLDRRLPL